MSRRPKEPQMDVTDPSLAEPLLVPPQAQPFQAVPGAPSVSAPPAQMPPPGDQPFWRASDAPEEEGEEGAEQQLEDAPPVELTGEEQQWFASLMTVGRRTKKISVMGHDVVIQNLNIDDDLRVGLWCREFVGAPPAEQRSYQVAVCACGIRSIGGKEIFTPLREMTEDELFAEKVERLRQYYPVVITKIYRAILELDAEFYELAQKLGKVEG